MRAFFGDKVSVEVLFGKNDDLEWEEKTSQKRRDFLETREKGIKEMNTKRNRIEPEPGQESVWDYPRPPRLEKSRKHIQVEFNGVVIADTRHAKRILETSHPPVYYIPPEDIRMEYLKPTTQSSFCEWKGTASYYTIMVGEKSIPNGAWYYKKPSERYGEMANYVAFYPGKMDVCYVDGEKVQAQAGDFYGGWVTNEIVGPFKGGAGTWGW